MVEIHHPLPAGRRVRWVRRKIARPAWAAQDLRRVLAVGLERGGSLLSAGERLVVRRMERLGDAAAEAWARLTTRVHAVALRARLDAPAAALDELERAGLIDTLAGWDDRLACFDVPTLSRAAAPLVGSIPPRRAALVARWRALVADPVIGPIAAARLGIGPRTFVRVRHRGLMRRLERFALASPWPDRTRWVVARLGHVRWPQYRCSSFIPWFSTRRSLLAWEGVGAEACTVDGLVGVLTRGDGDAPPPFDLRPRLLRALEAHATAAWRAGDGPAALRCLDAAVAHGASIARLGPARARILASRGDLALAIAVLTEASGLASPAERVAIDRAARRLTRRARAAWPPGPPLLAPPVRDVPLVCRDRRAPRPRYETADGPTVVEHAVRARLAALGRRAIHGEGSLWVTLLHLLLVDDGLFLPVPGMLPEPGRAGPFDAGTPEFARRRPEAIQRLQSRIEGGQAAMIVERAWSEHHGTRIVGVSWRFPPDVLSAVLSALGPRAVGAVVEVLLQEGWRAAAGLPDLVVLPGPTCAWSGSFPARIGPDALLVEVKSPTDSTRPTQQAWFHRLLRAGARVELWRIVERSS